MRHHVVSSLACQDPRLDITDVYLFQARGDLATAFVMCMNNPAPGIDVLSAFCPYAHYDFCIDANGDTVEDYTFRVVFGEAEDRLRQPLELRVLRGAGARNHSNCGDLMAWGTTDADIRGSSGSRLWAGSAEEPYCLDPAIVEVVRSSVQKGCPPDLSCWRAPALVDTSTGRSICAIVLELPNSFLNGLGNADGTIGVWGTTTLSTDAGGWRPIKRMGLPMVQTIFNPPGDERTSEYNATHPVDDRANYGALFAELVARLVDAHASAEDPQAYGAAVVRLILPDVLPYRIGSVASFNLAAFNGRSLTDNAPDVMLSIVTNRAISFGLHMRQAEHTPMAEFPYLYPRRALRLAAGDS